MATSKSHKLHEELQCTICLDLYDEPLELPCMHNFCQKCIGDIASMAKTAGQDQPGPDPQPSVASDSGEACEDQPQDSSEKSQKVLFKCPNCRQEFPLGSNDTESTFYGFRKNFLLKNIVERLKEQLESDESCQESIKVKERKVQCQVCEQEVKISEAKSCEMCNWIVYCGICVDQYHPNKGVFARHTLVPVREASQQVDVTCTQHSEKMRMYCMECHKPICYLCDRIGGHQQHKVEDIKIAFTDKMEVLKTCVQDLLTREKAVEDRIYELKKHVQKVKQTESDHTQKLEENCATIRILLTDREEKILATLSSKMKEVVGKSEENMKILENEEEKLSTVRIYVEEALKESRPAIFMLESPFIQNRVKEAIGAFDASKKVSIPTVIDLPKVDPQPVLAILAEYGVSKEDAVEFNVTVQGRVFDTTTEIQWDVIKDCRQYSIHLTMKLDDQYPECLVIKDIHPEVLPGAGQKEKFTLTNLRLGCSYTVRVSGLTADGRLKSSNFATFTVYTRIEYTELVLDAKAANGTVVVAADGKSMGFYDYPRSASVTPVVGTYKNFPGTRATKQLKTGVWYWEVAVEMDFTKIPSGNSFLMGITAVGICKEGFQDVVCPWDYDHTTLAYICRCRVSSTHLEHRIFRNVNENYSVPISNNLQRTSYRVQYALLLDLNLKIFIVCELRKNQHIFTFTGLELVTFYPVFSLYNGELSNSKMEVLPPPDRLPDIVQTAARKCLDHLDRKAASQASRK